MSSIGTGSYDKEAKHDHVSLNIKYCSTEVTLIYVNASINVCSKMITNIIFRISRYYDIFLKFHEH